MDTEKDGGDHGAVQRLVAASSPGDLICATLALTEVSLEWYPNLVTVAVIICQPERLTRIITMMMRRRRSSSLPHMI